MLNSLPSNGGSTEKLPAEKSKSKWRQAARYGLLGIVVILVLVASQGWLNQPGDIKDVAARRSMPQLVVPQLGGGTWNSEDHLGEVLLINFWASWCPPCRQETPGLARLAKDYQSKGLAVVGISLDEGGMSAVKAFVDEFHLPYPVGLPDADSPLIASVESLPTTILVDRHGRIAKTYRGAVRESVLQADVDRLLAESRFTQEQQGS